MSKGWHLGMTVQDLRLRLVSQDLYRLLLRFNFAIHLKLAKN